MALSLDHFTNQLIDSGLISTDELAAFIAQQPNKPADTDTLVSLLVDDNRLTQFQAEAIGSEDSLPLVLGEYVILDKIGAGGMGEVYKAQHRRMDRVVALKILPEKVTVDERAVKRFEREVKAAAKLFHPNIVTAFDAREDRGVTYLVMEYVDGSSLSAHVQSQGPVTVSQSINIIVQAARGLEYAHNNGVIHRDIKPANLLLTSEEVAASPNSLIKILDMGLARIEEPVRPTEKTNLDELTGTGTVMGTVDYMSPEQALSTKNADARSDIYSLGCTLYAVLIGKAVYDGDSAVERIFAHAQQPIPSLREAREDVPESLDTVFHKMVAKKVEDRYQTMTEVIADLQRIQVAAEQSDGKAGLTSGGAAEVSGLDSFFADNDIAATPTSIQVEKQIVLDESTHDDSVGQLTKPAIPTTDKLTQQHATNRKILKRTGAVVTLSVVAGIAWSFSGNDKQQAGREVAEVATVEQVIDSAAVPFEGNSNSPFKKDPNDKDKKNVPESPSADAPFDDLESSRVVVIPREEIDELFDSLSIDDIREQIANRGVSRLLDEVTSADRIAWAKAKGLTNEALQPGSIVVYKTHTGDLGKLQVIDNGKTLKFRFITYSPDGPISLENDQAEIKPTLSILLDTKSSTVSWRAATVRYSYLTPIGDTKVAVFLVDEVREAAEWVLQLGGKFRSEKNLYEANDRLPEEPFQIDEVYLSGCKIIPEDGLKSLKVLSNLSALFLESSTISDDSLKQVAELKLLRVLALSSTSISGAGLVHLQGLPHLQSLTTTNNTLTDFDLEQLKACSQLNYLRLDGCPIGDKGLVHLKSLKKLSRLYLNETQVSGAGIEHLKPLVSLHNLGLAKTKVTAAGIAELKKALPNCKIDY